MRSLPYLTLALASAAMAQAPAPDYLQIYPDAAGTSTTFTSRVPINNNAGELLQEIPGDFFKGVGDNGTACRLAGARYTHQDGDSLTQETYYVVVRRQNASGPGPDPTAAGIIRRSGPYMTPLGTGGAQAWTSTVTYSSAQPISCTDTFYIGLELSAATSNTDRQTVHTAYYYPAATQTGDNPRPGVRNLAWAIMGSAVSQPSPSRVWRMGVMVDTPVLNLGNIDPTSMFSPGGISYGAGGMWPAVKSATPPRDDGLMARVRDMANDGGLAFVLLAGQASPVPLPIPGIAGRAYINPAPPLLVLGPSSIVAGEAPVTIAPPGSIPATGVGVMVPFQALTVSSAMGNLRLSNLQATSIP